MKKIIYLSVIMAFLAAPFYATSCVRAKPGCKKNAKKIKKMRKNNPHFTM
ncbi:MAG: hypothetical protein ACK40G_12730 [Cytophagaceae bacterium]